MPFMIEYFNTAHYFIIVLHSVRISRDRIKKRNELYLAKEIKMEIRIMRKKEVIKRGREFERTVLETLEIKI